MRATCVEQGRPLLRDEAIHAGRRGDVSFRPDAAEVHRAGVDGHDGAGFTARVESEHPGAREHVHPAGIRVQRDDRGAAVDGPGLIAGADVIAEDPPLGADVEPAPGEREDGRIGDGHPPRDLGVVEPEQGAAIPDYTADGGVVDLYPFEGTELDERDGHVDECLHRAATGRGAAPWGSLGVHRARSSWGGGSVP